MNITVCTFHRQVKERMAVSTKSHHYYPNTAALNQSRWPYIESKFPNWEYKLQQKYFSIESNGKNVREVREKLDSDGFVIFKDVLEYPVCDHIRDHLRASPIFPQRSIFNKVVNIEDCRLQTSFDGVDKKVPKTYISFCFPLYLIMFI